MQNYGKSRKKVLETIKVFVKKHQSLLLILLIFILSCVWRFYQYRERWMFNQDEARDAIIAKYAIENKVIPLLGPPSSAGPFSFGPLYYWVVIILSLLFSFMINGPWFGFTLLSALSSVIMFIALKKMGGLFLGFVGGLLTAFSTGLIEFSTGMTNPILSGLAVFLLLYSIIFYLSESKKRYAVLIGLSLGLAVNAHLQSGVLMIIIPLIFLVSSNSLRNKLRFLFYSSVALIITFIPLIIFDIKNKGIWIKSVIEYLLHGQNKFYIPIRWLTEVKIFWPELLGRIIIGNEKWGFVLMGLLVLSGFIAFKKRWIKRSMVVIVLTFIFQVIAIRYYKGPRLPVYLLFLYPFLILFIAWMINIFWKINKNIGLILLALILMFSSKSNLITISNLGQSEKIFAIKEDIYTVEKGNFTFYSQHSSYMLSYPLLYLLGNDGRISKNIDQTSLLACDNFLKIIDPCLEIENNTELKNELITQNGGFKVYNVTRIDEKTKNDLNLVFLNEKIVYDRLFVNYPGAK